MSDAVALVKTIKKTAMEAQEAAKPVQICFGKVTGKAPLKIQVDQKLSLGEAQLVLSESVTDHKIRITEDGVEREVVIHNGLVVGDEVILLRRQGGQEYIVVDRIA